MRTTTKQCNKLHCAVTYQKNNTQIQKTPIIIETTFRAEERFARTMTPTKNNKWCF